MNIMEFENEAELLEYTLVTNGIIHAFEVRGWGLYYIGRGPMMFTSIEQIMEIVSFGRTEDVLEIGGRYMLLPLLKDSTDTVQMQHAIDAVCLRLGGPYFVELQSDEETVEIMSRHLIDSISLEPPFLELHLDVKFQQEMTENTVELPLATAANTICRQVLMSLRGPKVDTNADISV